MRTQSSWSTSDDDDDDAVSAVSALFFVLRGGLNDSSRIISSGHDDLLCSTLSPSQSLLLPLLLSGGQRWSIAMSTWDRTPLQLELQETFRGSVALVREDLTLASLPGPWGPHIADHSLNLNDGARRWVFELDGNPADEWLSSEDCRWNCGCCFCLPNNDFILSTLFSLEREE